MAQWGMRTYFQTLGGFLACLMITLCLGGLWAMLRLMWQADLGWFALLVGASAWLWRGYLSHINRALAAGIAASTALFGMGYAQALHSIHVIALSFDVPFLDTAARMGLAMVCDLAWLRLSPALLGFMLAGTVLAGWLGGQRRGQTGNADRGEVKPK